MPASINDVCEKCGADRKSVTLAIRALHAAGLCRIVSYRPRVGSGGPAMACYALGSGRDAPRPKPDKVAAGRRWRAKTRGMRRPFDAMASALASNSSVFNLRA
jgi:hypothetical protein